VLEERSRELQIEKACSHHRERENERMSLVEVEQVVSEVVVLAKMD
jgi:hypothetical protein